LIRGPKTPIKPDRIRQSVAFVDDTRHQWRIFTP